MPSNRNRPMTVLRLGPVLLVAAMALASCADDGADSPQGRSTTSATVESTTITSALLSTIAVSSDSPVGRFVSTIKAEDGRPDLAGPWGFNLEADGKWTICPFCQTIPGTFGGTYDLAGNRITLQPDSTCFTAVPYEWHAEGAELTLTALADDPCGLQSGNRQFVLTKHPLTRVG